MADIDKLIQDLQSDNPGKRFQACNTLFYEQSIPDRAIEALREATQESDPVIANAAQRALDVHAETSTIPHNQLEVEFKQTPMTDLDGVIFMVLAGIIAAIISFGILVLIVNSSILDFDGESLNSYFIVGVILFIPAAFLTALLGFGLVFTKLNTPDSQIGLGIFILISTVFGVISGFVWQLIIFLLTHLG